MNVLYERDRQYVNSTYDKICKYGTLILPKELQWFFRRIFDIDRGLKKCMFCDAIISIDKAIIGKIYYQRISQSTWDYLIEKAI